MDTKHTPGPWQLGTESEGFFIANGELRPDIAKRITSAADARLIAAAPELLAALQDIAKYTSATHADCAVQVLSENARIAQAAIAKAIGDQA